MSARDDIAMFRDVERRHAGELRDWWARRDAEDERRRAVIERITGRKPTRGAQSVYGPDSEFSYFADLLTVSERMAYEAQLRAARIGKGALPAAPPAVPGSDGLGMLQRGGAEMARERLSTVRFEGQRAGDTTSATAGGEFVAGQVPGFVREAFATAARAGAVVAPLFQSEPLARWATKGGASTKSITVPRVDTGASVAVQTTENTTVSNTEHVSSAQTSLVSTLSGYTSASRQLWDLGGGVADVVIAADLGAAYASKLDSELLNGTNSGQRTAGLIGLSGQTTGTYTDASPDVLSLLAALSHLHRLCHEARGIPPTHAILSARTLELLASDLTAWKGNPDDPRLPSGERIIVSANMPTNLGAGTNQSIALLVTASDLILCGGEMQLMVASENAGMTALMVTALVYSHAAAGHKRAEGVGQLSGTGLAA